MEYLFFDIEASEGKSICSFGYVLTDEFFNILEKDDILINPQAEFCTCSRGKNKDKRGITLAYPEHVFRQSPTFPEEHKRIENLLSRENQIIVGFSHSNDVRYLCTACKRYSMPFFQYKFFDVQDAYRDYVGDKEQNSLESVTQKLGLDIEKYTLHKSVDDAEVSMLLTKAMCEKFNLSISEFIDKYSKYLGETRDGGIWYRGVDAENSLMRKERNICGGVVAAFANNHRMRRNKKSALYGKKICSANKFIKEDWKFALKFVEKLAENGVRFVHSVSEADFYVKFSENEGKKGDRLYNLQKNPQDYSLKVIEKDELYALLGTTEEEINLISTPQIEKTIAETEKRLAELKKESNIKKLHTIC